MTEKHTGPVCKECGTEFYYDYIPSPSGFVESGLCDFCWLHHRADWGLERAALQIVEKEG